MSAPTDIVGILQRVAENGIAPEGGAEVLDVGTGPFLEYLEREILTSLVANGRATCKIVRGQYGSGKTHLIDLIRSRSLQHGFAVVRTDLSHQISFDDPHTLVRHLAENLEAVVSGMPVRSLPALVTALAQARTDSGERIGSQLPHPGYGRAIYLLANKGYATLDGREMLERFLMGDRIPAGEFAARGMRGVKNPLNGRNAESALRTITLALKALGLNGLVLLFDETETTFVFRGGRPPAKMQKAANFLRRWIDGCASGRIAGAIAVLTVLPNFIEQCSLAYDALGQRLRPIQSDKVYWRAPLLDITEIIPGLTPDEFVRQLADRFTGLAKQQSRISFSPTQVANVGLEALSRHAGDDYRRFAARDMARYVLTGMEL